MLGQRIDVTFGPDGSVTVEAHGIKGPACKDATKFVEQALGGRTLETRRTGEWSETARADERARTK